ncbi:MAG: hypothetical protein ACI3YT_10420 [Prevotella sp.]
MKRNDIIILIVILSYFILPQTGYEWNGSLLGHFIYPVCHANIFHLLANCFVVWMLRLPLYNSAWFFAVLCSFLPCFADQPTYGLSGVIFAHIGITWAKYGNFKNMCIKILPMTIISGLLPHVNMLIHVYCLFVAYFFTLLNNTKRYAKQ